MVFIVTVVIVILHLLGRGFVNWSWVSIASHVNLTACPHISDKY